MNFCALYQKICLIIFQYPRIVKYKIVSSCAHVSGRFQGHYPILFSGKGEIEIGKDVVCGYKNSPCFWNGYAYIEARNQDSKIQIGNSVHMNNGVTIICDGGNIVISDDVLIGYHCEIVNSDGHALDPSHRHDGQAKSEDIQIGKNVFIGSNVKILKGVNIGENAVIANGSVVTKSIPSNSVAAGIPAKVVRAL